MSYSLLFPGNIFNALVTHLSEACRRHNNIIWLSVGGFIAVANLAYKLVLALSESSGSGMDYLQLIQDLSCVHQTLLQVEQMKDAHQLNQSTINALIYQVDSTKQPMQAFLEKAEK